MARLFSFPNPVNEKAARIVAAGVCALSAAALATGTYWLLAVLAYGFVARVIAGPKLSPLGQVATRLLAPRLGPATPVAGPPKRFAQAIGAAFTIAGALFALVARDDPVADGLLAVMILASGLESIFAFCLGCKAFALLMRAGLIPRAVCAECANIGPAGRSPGLQPSPTVAWSDRTANAA